MAFFWGTTRLQKVRRDRGVCSKSDLGRRRGGGQRIDSVLVKEILLPAGKARESSFVTKAATKEGGSDRGLYGEFE